MDANEYTAEMTPELASRFLLAVGIGLPARRATCLLELQQHITRTFGGGAPKRVEQINRNLLAVVRDWYFHADVTGQPLRRFQGI
ncbi:hypothetical protein AB0F77_39745 [Streptomyces sp. NPDC026672]|uniref:hypothetical protein n=1 Tax=Actinomycetes TaxID=1760 RepID=UPI0033DFB584